MTQFEKIEVSGKCGHTFETQLPEDSAYFVDQESLDKLLSGEIAFAVCPVCNERVVIFHGFVIDTLCEKIGLFPNFWEEIIIRENPDVDTIIFEEYGEKFSSLKKYLISLDIITEDEIITESYNKRLSEFLNQS